MSGIRKTQKPVSQVLVRHPELGVLAVLLIFLAVFGATAPNFLSVDSLTSMFTVAAETGIVAVAVSFLMIAGEFDISVGSVMGIATLIFCWLANHGVIAIFALLITLAVTGLMGALNGAITLKLGIPSFITTLGTMMLWRGLHNYLTNGFPVFYADPALRRDDLTLNVLGGCPLARAPMFHMTCFWFVVLAVVFGLILNHTRYGNHVFATGGDARAARNAGVKVGQVKMINFTLCSLLAGFAGAANLARYRSSQGQLGVGLELEAIAACVIGGNLLTGGSGTILGTFLGALLMSVIYTGLISVGISSYLYLPLTGVVVIVAVVMNGLIRKVRL